MDYGKGTGTVNAASASFRSPGGSSAKRQREGSHWSRFSSDRGNRLDGNTETRRERLVWEILFLYSYCRFVGVKGQVYRWNWEIKTDCGRTKTSCLLRCPGGASGSMHTTPRPSPFCTDLRLGQVLALALLHIISCQGRSTDKSTFGLKSWKLQNKMQPCFNTGRKKNHWTSCGFECDTIHAGHAVVYVFICRNQAWHWWSERVLNVHIRVRLTSK